VVLISSTGVVIGWLTEAGWEFLRRRLRGGRVTRGPGVFHDGVGYLCGVEKPGIRVAEKDACQEGVRDAGDEVADVDFAVKRRHGAVVGKLCRFLGGGMVFSGSSGCFIGLVVGGTAAVDGGVGTCMHIRAG